MNPTKATATVLLDGPDAGCWESNARTDKQGYARVNCVRHGQQINLHHRLAWIEAFGRLPAPGMQINHRCDNKVCVNPMHLYEGTHADNMRDAVDRNRMNPEPGRLAALLARSRQKEA